jgi:hypothetical protein
MKVEKLLLVSVALAVLCVPQIVHAAPNPIPAGDKTLLVYEDDVEFYFLSTMLAEVDTYVYQYDTGDYAGDYLYTYQVTGKSVYSLSFFSVAVSEYASDITFYETGYAAGGTEPIIWLPIGTPPQCIDALFADAIAYEDDSALLWFVCDGTYTTTEASVTGANSGRQASAINELYSPAPEPATLVMLGVGSLCLISRKRK